MSTTSAFIPLSLLLDDIGAIPADLLEAEGGSSTLDKIGVMDMGIIDNETEISFSFTLIYTEEILFSLPGLNDAWLVFGQGEDSTEQDVELDLQPSVELRLPEAAFALRFSSDLLRPVVHDGDKYVLDDSTDTIEIGIEAAVSASNGQINIDNANDLLMSPFMISDSGIVIDVGTLSIDLSQSVSMVPEAEEAGYDASWMGVYIPEATLYLPTDLSNLLPDGITVSECFIGSGGFTGEVTADWTPELNSDGDAFVGNGSGDIFGIPLALSEVSISVQRNSFEQVSLKALVILPFFDQLIACEIGLTNDGDFTLAISAEQELPDGITQPTQEDGLFVFTREDLMTLKLQSIAFTQKDGDITIDLSGSIKPLLLADQLSWPEFDVKKLSISSDGSVSIDGGWLEMSGQQTLDFHGYQIEITRLGFGNEDNSSRWVGFSGGVQLVEGLPLKGGVEGLKLLWGDGDIRLEIDGINVAFEIENTLSFDGRVYFIDEDDNKGFKGGIKVSLPPLSGLMLDGQFMTGKVTSAPAYKYAYIYLGIELPVGIPLGSTGASLYGLAGLVGYNSTMDKRDDEAWYENDDGSDGFYKRGTDGVTSVDKWTNARDAMAFGAGVTLGTSPDNGFAFTGKVLLAVLIPGPVIIIEGRASFLTERSSGTEDPNFTLLAVLDPSAGTYLFNVGANYKLDKSKGFVVDLSGTAEAFFDANDPKAWHFYIGQDSPESKRIQATVLSLFKASAYFMLDNNGLLLGGKAGYDETWKFSVLKVILQAYIEGQLAFNIKPIHAEAGVLLVGNVELSACGVGLGLSVSTSLEVQTPTPWLIRGDFKVKLNLPWPLPDPSATVELEWKEEAEPPTPLVLAKIGMEHNKTTETWPLTISPDFDTDDDGFQDTSSTSEPSDACSSSPMVPPDGIPAISFSKSLKDTYNIADNPASEPESETVGDYEYRYELLKITLEKKEKSNSASWQTVAEAGEGAGSYDATIRGMWQSTEDEPDSNTKLMLWVNTPYELSRNLEDNTGFILGLENFWLHYPCSESGEAEVICINFDDIVGQKFWYYLLRDDVIFQSLYQSMDIIKFNGAWAGVHSGLRLGKWRSEPIISDCANIPELRTGISSLKITSNKVLFKAGLNSQGDDYYPLTTRDQVDPRRETEIHIGSSTNKKDFTSIIFPVEDFPQAPDYVSIRCTHGTNSITFYGKNDRGEVLDTATHSSGSHVVETLYLSGNGIRSIDVSGSEIILLEVCYGFQPGKDEQNKLSIIFPENVNEVSLYLSLRSSGYYEILDESNQIVETRNYSITSQRPLVIKRDDNQNYRSIDLHGSFTLLKACYITAEQAATQAYNDSISTRFNESLDEVWSHSAEVLESNYYYRLSVKTLCQRRKNSGDWEDTEFEEHAYFQTGNPPGAFDSEDSNGEDVYPYGGLLMNLNPYVSRTIPEQVASNARIYPAYRSYDIGVEFNESQGYVEQMYLSADLQLKIQLFDNNDQPATDANGDEIIFDNNWADNPELALTREEEQWLSTLNNSTCDIDTSSLGTESTTTYLGSSENLALKAMTLYKAKLIAEEQYSVFNFTFVTSRYCHFVLHLHSFIDQAWSHQSLNDSPEDDLLETDGKNDLETVLSAFTKRTEHGPNHFDSEAEAIAFEQINTLFALNHRQLPEQLEVTVMDDEDNYYGLLLESPEPLNWSRITMGVKYLNRQATLSESADSMKLINWQLGTGIDGEFNSEYIDILIQEKLNPADYTLTVQGPDEDEASSYYQFSSENIIAGKILRIFSGAEEEQTLPAGYQAIHAGDDSATFHFEEGSTINIVDADGNILHTRTIATGFSNKKSRVIRNTDQTRAFIFIAKGSSSYTGLKNGAYQLHFSFERDIGSDDVVLKMQGNSDAEEAFIEFDLPGLLPPK